MQTVLLVDDDVSFRGLLQNTLAVEGYHVLCAGTAAEALAQADESVDLVSFDLTLPDMDGRELSTRLRDDPATRSCRQLAVSEEPALQSPAPVCDRVDAVLRKPFDARAFAAVLHGLFDRPVQPQPDSAAGLLDAIIGQRLVRPVFQPIVDLADGSVVGMEALARGPAGPLHTPNALFEAATAAGRLHELDVLCRLTALTAARDAAAVPPLVFVNVEPGTVDLPMSDELRELLHAPLPFQVVVEFTERALTRRVPALLRHADEIRSRNNVVALDDIGADASSMALLPLVRPEIVKLDMSLLRPETEDATRTAVVAATYAERTGATVIAEGIETEAHLSTALALGAQWGQGYLFGRPGDIAGVLAAGSTPPATRLRPRARIEVTRARTPMELARSAGVPVRTAARDVVVGIARSLSEQAAELGVGGSVMMAMRHAGHFTDACRELCTKLVDACAVVTVLGAGIPAEPAPGVYGVDIGPGDALRDESAFVIVGRRDSVCFIARRCAVDSDTGVTMEFVLSHDRALGERLARDLMRRIVPRPTAVRTTAMTD